MARKKTTSVKQQIIDICRDNLFKFAQVVCPERLYGDVHREAFDFFQSTGSPYKLLMLPRGHMKSHCIALAAAWRITFVPTTTILYISSTASLAIDQLYAIKNILTSRIYRQYWPEMVHEDEGKREKWSQFAIAIDHPARKAEGIRDMTVVAAGIDSSTTGKHADLIIADDVVEPNNAYTAEGRNKVSKAMSQMASILNPGGCIWACGTRYHPDDQYSKWKEQTYDVFDEHDEIVGKEQLWDIMEKVVETEGKFLWPRAIRDDGKAFGFDKRELSRIFGTYDDKHQYYAQYYNDPNGSSSSAIDSANFQYYDRDFLKEGEYGWEINGKPLALYAAIDFAYTVSKTSDYTAIVVVGVTEDSDVYVIDIDRFKTNKIAEYFKHIEDLHLKWGFRKLRAECTAAQSLLVNDLKDKIRERGRTLKVEEHKPTKHMGAKEERIAAVLSHRYEDLKIWHYKGGHTIALEDELVVDYPKHDDIKDALACAIEISKPAIRRKHTKQATTTNQRYNSRFGGRNFRGR